MQIFLLIRNPDSDSPRVRGVFTTANKAKNHDPDLKGMWSSGPSFGWFENNKGSITGSHRIVRPASANEELNLYGNTDVEDV